MGGKCCFNPQLNEEYTESDLTDLLKIEIFSVIPSDQVNISHLKPELQSDFISISSNSD